MRLTDTAISNILNILTSDNNLALARYIRLNVFPTVDQGPTFEIYDIDAAEITTEDSVNCLGTFSRNGNTETELVSLYSVIESVKVKYFTDIVVDVKDDGNNNPIIVFYKDNG